MITLRVYAHVHHGLVENCCVAPEQGWAAVMAAAYCAIIWGTWLPQLKRCSLLLPSVTCFHRRGRSLTHSVCHYVTASGTVKLPTGYNPATWMLEVTGGAMATLIPANTAVDWPEHYLISSLALENARQAEVLVQEVRHKHMGCVWVFVDASLPRTLHSLVSGSSQRQVLHFAFP